MLDTVSPSAPTTTWESRAVCRGGPAVFYPSAQESDAQRLLRVSRAKSICATCPVRTPCLEYALRQREPLGIWAGLTESERRVLTDR